MTDTLLVLNAGSSSLKFSMFRQGDLGLLARGQVSRIDGAATFTAGLTGKPPETRDMAKGADHVAALESVLDFIDRHDDSWRIAAVAHRVVHGGSDFTGPILVNPQVIQALAALTPLAPLHQPHNLAAIDAAGRLLPKVANIACFDTAFHTTLPELHSTFALRRELRDKGIWRYGFHGLSYRWIARVLSEDHPQLAAGRVVAAHLGNGASLCAMRGGESLDTTMGLTALDGLTMGTRAGAIDAGAVLYMQRALGMSIEDTEDELYRRSGLLGLSGLSNDVETLLGSDDPRAGFALDHFALRVAQFSAKMAVSMGGLDGVVFTGGIGEHAAPVREAILARLAFLAPFEVQIIPANEERMMAIEAQAVLSATG
ncbi:acetate/propionate family kinase [Oceaniglobus trochenteri]|uniref:acetate/propionate family kinase n=1 Tax=Oceaniglobus trochenteri TaxID=2763260 RepID=UPI001CFFAB3F|nr:acetate/propionate family kinase [Oceaniglobus trochenteri]